MSRSNWTGKRREKIVQPQRDSQTRDQADRASRREGMGRRER
jgi:hypothetical protein